MQPLSWVSCDPVPDSERVELGYVNGVFGVRGEVRLYLHNREADWLGRPRAVLVESAEGRCYSVRLRTRRGAGKRILGRLDGAREPLPFLCKKRRAGPHKSKQLE